MGANTASDPHSRRARWSLGLVIFGSVLALVTTLNTWVERQALDTDAWVDATDELLADDDIRAALAAYLVEELYSSVDVGEAIGELLPPDFERLGGVLAGALRAPATETVARLLETDAAREAWSNANRAAHATMLAVIEDDTGNALSTADGVVSIDLQELVRSLGQRVGLEGDVLDRLPDDAGIVVLFESEELEFVQDAAQTVKLLSSALFALVVVSFAAAIYLSADRRRTVRDCGIGLVTVGLLVALARLVGVNTLANNLSRASDDEPAVSILEIGSSLLRQVALTEILIGAVLIGFALLGGSSPTARQLRGLLAPALRHGTIAAVGGGLVVFLLLLWIKPSGPIDGWIVAISVASLCVAGVAWIQRVTLAELPAPAAADDDR